MRRTPFNTYKWQRGDNCWIISILRNGSQGLRTWATMNQYDYVPWEQIGTYAETDCLTYIRDPESRVWSGIFAGFHSADVLTDEKLEQMKSSESFFNLNVHMHPQMDVINKTQELQPNCTIKYLEVSDLPFPPTHQSNYEELDKIKKKVYSCYPKFDEMVRDYYADDFVMWNEYISDKLPKGTIQGKWPYDN